MAAHRYEPATPDPERERERDRDFGRASLVNTHASVDERTEPRGLTRAELMTAREVADLLAVPISTVREWGRNGTLPRVKLGRHVRYIRSHVGAAILEAEQERRAVRR